MTLFLTEASPAGSMSTMLIMMVAMIAVFYFFMIRPENKKKKKMEEMRNSLSLGEEIVTIGGIIGKIVQVTEDTVTFETGEDRVRLQVKKWAIPPRPRWKRKKLLRRKASASKLPIQE